MKYKEIKYHSIKDFTLEKEKLIKKGWECKSEQSYRDGFLIMYKAQFIKDKNKDKDFKTFLKEIDDLLMTQHQRLMNITIRCEENNQVNVIDFDNQVKVVKGIRNVIKNYNMK